jgi:hypothetical protein
MSSTSFILEDCDGDILSECKECIQLERRRERRDAEASVVRKALQVILPVNAASLSN